MSTQLKPVDPAATVAPSQKGQPKKKHKKSKGKSKHAAQRAAAKNANPKGQPGEGKPRANPWAKAEGIDWTVVIWIGLVHIGALAAPFYFTWQALVVAFCLTWLTGCIGVTLGYHRQLTHGSFSTYPLVRWFMAFCGGLSGEGSAVTWVANHRKHHVFSDQEGDPHSPRDGGLWSHFTWLVPEYGRKHHDELTARYAPDLVKDKVMVMLHKLFLPIHIGVGALLFAAGWSIWDMHMGISFVVWGMFVRLVYVYHITWFVNSATHMWGYRNYQTTDDSRNLWWVGLLAWGEGWHNNHHAYQRMARHGHKWWEIDMTYWTILAMEKLGLAWNVVHDVPSRQREVAEATPAA